MSAATRQRLRRRLPSRPANFNITSLMDIFVIIVFFLLVNTGSETDKLSTDKVELPESVAEKKPEDTSVLMLTDDQVLLQGRVVASTQDIIESEADSVPAIERALREMAQQSVLDKESSEGRSITILGDKKVPYKLLQKVMASCRSAGYPNIHFAVTRKESIEG